jgi:hypothetical protein
MARLLRIVVLALCVGAVSSPATAQALGVSVSGSRLGFGIGFRDHLLKLRRHARR